MSLDAGALDTQVYLSGNVEIPDESGGASAVAGDELMVWAQMKPANWRQVQFAMQRQQRVDVVLYVRWDAALVGFREGVARYTDRAGTERRLTVMTCVDPDGEGECLELMCVEGAPR